MEALVIRAAGDLRVEPLVTPDVSPGQLRVRVCCGGICGSDLHYYQHGGFQAGRKRQRSDRCAIDECTIDDTQDTLSFQHQLIESNCRKVRANPVPALLPARRERTRLEHSACSGSRCSRVASGHASIVAAPVD